MAPLQHVDSKSSVCNFSDHPTLKFHFCNLPRTVTRVYYESSYLLPKEYITTFLKPDLDYIWGNQRKVGLLCLIRYAVGGIIRG